MYRAKECSSKRVKDSKIRKLSVKEAYSQRVKELKSKRDNPIKTKNIIPNNSQEFRSKSKNTLTSVLKQLTY